MTDISANNKRIARNTLLLYFRQLLLAVISLYTSRIILNTLGVEDYGVYNVVGGVVAMFSLLTGSLGSAISRFMVVGLGKGDKEQLNKLFCTSINVQACMAVVVFVLCEVLGVWFLNTRLNIPPERLDAANWVLHMSIITFCINLVSVPINASIIAHEHMDVYAYISILEGVFKLGAAYCLIISPFDKLKTYAILIAGVALIIRLIYALYCGRKFEECHYHLIFDKKSLKEMASFAGWNFFGSGAYLFNTQGVNILTNVFFGVTANAARGVANQAEGIIKQFVTNFTTAINPQIMKSYASGNLDYTYSLVCRGAKFSYYLMLLFAVPFMFEAETIMTIWLKNYPPEAPLFLRLSMVGALFDMLGNSSTNAAWATGNIKRYYLYVASTRCLVFPLSWIAFALGSPAFTSYIILAIIYLIVVFVKPWILNGLMNFPHMMFLKEVLFKVIAVTAVSVILPYLFYAFMPDTLIWHLILICVSGLSACASVYLIGLTSGERHAINETILNRISKLAKK